MKEELLTQLDDKIDSMNINLNRDDLDTDSIFYKLFQVDKLVKDFPEYESIIKTCVPSIIISLNDKIDFKITNLTNIKKCKLSITFIIGISTLLKNAFPDKLHKCFLQNSSMVFRGIYSLIKTVIDKETRNKITIIKDGEYMLSERTLEPRF